jgi:hypothetical protein
MGAGETEFADMRAAYDALSPQMKEKIEPLVAEHYALYSRIWLGDEDWTQEQKAAMAPVRWRMVRTQPYGRKSRSVRTPTASSAGRCPRAACSCSTCWSTRPSVPSSIATNGRSAIW